MYVSNSVDPSATDLTGWRDIGATIDADQEDALGPARHRQAEVPLLPGLDHEAAAAVRRQVGDLRGRPADREPATVRLTHPEREIWPGDGITKRELYDYFGAIADVMLPHVRERPVSMQRFRGSVEDGGFFMKEVPKGAPDWVATVEVPKRGGVVHHVLANDRETLQWLAQQGCVTPHVFTERADRLDRPDRLVVDLDPSHEDFAAVRRGGAGRRRGLPGRGPGAVRDGHGLARDPRRRAAEAHALDRGRLRLDPRLRRRAGRRATTPS